MDRYVAIFTEGSFETIERFGSSSYAQFYAHGVVCGANLYGAGSCTAYVMPDEESGMREIESANEVKRALDAIAKEAK